MRLRILNSFRDKPSAARRFKTDIIKRIKGIPKMPYANRKSIFFDREDIRYLVFKGYIIVYKIDDENQTIDVFGFTKYENDPFTL
ncbi:MAG: type II toxin-antitoxin system RelE/ParE family toxin [Bacteroidales bacterium]|nr:type II toxin-antitoxin system RelE/ParE family toxin [Bacteroidales bacterium]